MPAPDLTAAGLLAQFENRASGDPAKRDLELTHVPCGRAVCDVEDGDTLEVLASAAAGHACHCPGKPPETDPVRNFLHGLAVQLNTAHGFHWNAGDVQAELIRQMRLHGVDENAGLRKRST